jgi:hypothetical protein
LIVLRLTSEFWVSALVRRVSTAGAFCVVLQKGAAEAGAIFLVIRRDADLYDLLSPALQMSYEAGQPPDRLFEKRLTSVSESEIEAQLSKERRFDPDIWVVEVEGCEISDFVKFQDIED